MSTITGAYADETINGDSASDTISGGGGNDRIIGGLGNDTLYAFGPQDTDPNSGVVQAHLMPHVNNPVGMTSAPGDANDLYIVNMAGEIDVLNTSTGQMRSNPFLTLPSSSLGSGGERGLEAITFDPNYQSNGEFYVSLADPAGDFQVWRYTRSSTDPTVADPNSATLIISIPHSNDSHYAGWLNFGPDGYLYIATGDNDIGPSPSNPAGDPESLLGKILRIDVHTDDFPGDPSRNYGIPASNPFAGSDSTAPEIFASGLRNAWRGSFDPATGNLYVADVGENTQEELDMIPAGSPGGQNFGWPTMEGNLGPGGSQFTAPIYTYDHGSGANQGDCIIGGYVYHGPGGADGLYIFGDFSVPNIWAADIENGVVKSVVNLDSAIQADVGSISLITSFGTDAQGRLYAATVYGALYQFSFGADVGSGATVISGGSGNDAIYGGAGGDQLYGGTGVDMITGGVGADVLDGGGQSDTLTGGGGADRFVISFVPEGVTTITDLTLGVDHLDLNALLARAGYQGNDPVSDGWVTVAPDASDGSYVYFDPDGSGPKAPILVADLLHVAPTTSNLANALAIYTPRAAASTADSVYLTPANITDVTLTGSAQTVIGNDAGDNFYSNDTGNHLVGGGGQDTFHLGGGGDVATGGAGADIFLFDGVPATAAHITDFAPGEDIVDLSSLLNSLGYRGANAAGDGYLKVADDGAGDTQVWVNTGSASAACWAMVATLDGVAVGNVEADGALVVAAADPPPGYGGTVSTSDSTYTAPAGVTDITLTGSAQTVIGNSAGDTFHSNNTGNHLIGGTGNDTFDIGRAGDTVTGGGGIDVFAFAETPWSGAMITDFGPQDTVDLTGLLARSGYTGSDPVTDGYIKITADAQGNAQIWSDLDQVSPGAGWYLVATLDGVATSALAVQGDSVVMASSTGGGGTTTGGGSSVSTSDSTYTAPAGVTDITLTGSGQTVTGNNAGDTFHSNNTGNHLIGGTGADTFDIGRGGDIVTGGGGTDIFAFAETPWAGSHITDFGGYDVVDLSGLLARSGYTGSDPVGAGYIKITSDGSGNAEIWSDLDQVSPGAGWYVVTTLQNVAPTAIQMQGDSVVMAGSSGGGGTSGGGSSVSTSASPYTAPAGVTDITLTGSGQTVTGNNAGDTFHSNNTGNHLIGGSGNDTFDIGRAGDTVTGGGGSDTFAYAETPWGGSTITDFDTAHDRMDLTGLLARSNYAGSDAIADGYIKITNDGAGDAQVWSNLDSVSPGAGWYLVATVDHVPAASLHLHGAFITG